jgi:arylsulfatase A-like enzyme
MRMTRLRLACALSIAWSACATAPIASDRPNILLVMVDDLGPEWISCYGAEGIATPHIDALASGGMRFTSAYSMPKCTPTRATLLTGQYPFRHGWVNHWDVPRWGAGCHFDPKHNITFARLLKDAGYATAIAGKWQINDFRVQPDVLRELGFDDWCMWTGYESGNPPSGKRYWNPYIFTRAGSRTYSEKFGADVFTDFLVGFMNEHRDRPMMMYFPMALTHGPLVATPLEPNVTNKMDKHRAMVRYVDHCMGRLVAKLDELDLRRKTIIIFTTDNGTSRGIRGQLAGRAVRGGKGKISETGCWQPFIVNAPGITPAGVVTDALTDFTDILPTLVDLGCAKRPPGVTLDGHSIAALIRGETGDSERQWIMSMGGGVAKQRDGRVIPAKDYADRAVRDKRHKLWVVDGKPAHLYDLARDPGETLDLFSSTDPKHLAARTRLEAVIATFPPRDAAPRYDPTPRQPWDRKPRQR